MVTLIGSACAYLPPAPNQHDDGYSEPSPIVVNIVDAQGHPLVATLLVDGQALFSTPNSSYSVPFRYGGATMQLDATGFVPRTTQVRNGSIQMWPTVGPDYLSYIRSVVYAPAWPASALSRPLPGTYSLCFEGVLANSPVWTAELFNRLAADVQSLTAGAISLTRVDTGGAIRLEVNPDELDRNGGGEAMTINSMQNNVITAGRIIVHSTQSAERYSIVLHEVGHFCGFGHSPDVTEIMYPSPHSDFAPDFGRLPFTYSMMLRRPTGTRYEDNDLYLVPLTIQLRTGSTEQHVDCVIR